MKPRMSQKMKQKPDPHVLQHLTTGGGKTKGLPVMATSLFLQTQSRRLERRVRLLTLRYRRLARSICLSIVYGSVSGHRSSRAEGKGQTVLHIYIITSDCVKSIHCHTNTFSVQFGFAQIYSKPFYSPLGSRPLHNLTRPHPSKNSVLACEYM